ncbi:glutaredoxin [Nitzschia inconspicua]|uniref:Glutaredoxin n=1 Tax=Nitzschia inconspicua TaxID=303405 RepID=A0A9K3LVW1_9STRA|nr:glutaredoxin [Nitzschia inconspicua]
MKTFMNLASALLSAMILLASTSDALSTKPPSAPAPAIVKANPVINLMANGMTLLKPVFAAEAKLQASLLGSGIVEQDVAQEIAAEVNSSPIVIYTYGLSPFSTEAVSILEKNGYDFKKIELGAEWFLLNGKDSVKRVLLSDFVDNGATSLPKVFVGGKCIGGCADLAKSVESGEFATLVNSGKNTKKKMFSFL